MNKPFEKLWVSFLDSPRFRDFAGRGIGKSFFESRAYHRLRFAKNQLASSLAALARPDQFRDVKTFCLFVGHNKSGTSMLGSLLDAHPNVILADEIGALDYLAAGFRRDQVFQLLLTGSRRELLKGRVTARRLTPYAYLVPGQWQGRFSRLQVIGDGKAGAATRRFAADPQLWSRLQAALPGVDVKLVQVIRNPFDVISVMMVRGGRTFENATGHYFDACEALAGIRRQAGASLHPVRYEAFVARPAESLARLCRFLGLEPHEGYLRACAAILHDRPDRRRQMVAWTPEWIAVVQGQITKYDFLQGYRFDA